MATLYCSNVDTTSFNGIGLGSDSNTYAQMQNKATPGLTIKHMLTVSGITDGDIIIVNGGSAASPATAYADASTYTTTTAFTLYPDQTAGAQPVTWTDATAGDSRIVTFVTAKNVTLGQLGGPVLIMDGSSNQAQCFVQNAGSQTLQLFNVQFQNWTTQSGAVISGCGTFLAYNCTFIAPTSGATACLALTGSGASQNYTVRGCTFTFTAVTSNVLGVQFTPHSSGSDTFTFDSNSFTHSTASAFSHSMFFSSSANGATVTVTNNIVNYTNSSAGNFTYRTFRNSAAAALAITGRGNTHNLTLTYNSSATVNVWEVNTTSTVDLSLETISITGVGTFTSSSGFNGILISNPTSSGTTTLANIHNNKLTATNTGGQWAGQGITIGSNSSSPTNAYHINNAFVWQNTINGFNHGVLLGAIGGGLAFRNYITNGHYGVVVKNSQAATPNASLVFANVLDGRNSGIDSTGASLLGRSAQSDKFFNNLILRDSTTVGVPWAQIYQDAADQGPSNNVLFANNIVWFSSGQPTALVSSTTAAGVGSDVSNGTFRSNCYFLQAGVAQNAWVWEGVTYSGQIAWLQVEPDAIFADPQFLNPLASQAFANGNYRIAPTSPLVRAGIFVDWRAVDYRGRQFGSRPTIGLYELTSRDGAVLV